ncbi:MAG: MerR family transcriptional regulator [Candidatus Krumholzibacteriia bacterium]
MGNDSGRSDPIPRKLYYTISEVAELTGVKPHVLRYWESEFSTLRPGKGRSGSRRYRRTDIDEVLAIKTLLYDEGFKIAGARKLRREAHQRSRQQAQAAPTQLAMAFGDLDRAEQVEVLRRDTREILGLLHELRAGVSTPDETSAEPDPRRTKTAADEPRKAATPPLRRRAARG